MNQNEIVEAFRSSIKAEIAGIHTAMPGKIVAYAGGLASVQPSVKFKVPDGRAIDMPVIVGVPVIMPSSSGGSASISLPIKPGDGCLLVFAERSIDDWMTGGESDDPRRHDLTDCFAIPGCYTAGTPAGNAHPDDLVLAHGGTVFKIPSSGPMTVTGADLIVDGISIKEHVHRGVAPGGGNTGVPVG